MREVVPNAERGARRPPPEPHARAASGGGGAHRSEAQAKGGVPRGAWGEEAAVAHVVAHGGRVLARNFRCKAGEIDLIAAVEGVVVFGEVKARRNRSWGGGREAVGWQKRTRIFRTAIRWCRLQGLDPDRVAMRFDVFEVAPGPVVTWVRAAFDAEGLPVG